ncbi:MAG: acetylornithine transaminase [Myxococcota bacterium]|jgi:predicted acetylornithine/succinylornithine family transaminase|nr:acetylornithine transaminase [Myxococcota bacterium]
MEPTHPAADPLAQALAVFTPNVRPRRVFVRGEGARIWDRDGRAYLDFLAGIGVNLYGHCHPRLVAAVRQQVGTLGHVSNLFVAPPTLALAQELVQRTFAGRVCFTNSGAEAIEAGLKLARGYFRKVRGEDRFEIVATVGGFHGRTLGALACTGTPKYHKGFEPLPGGVVHVPYGDADAVAQACGPHTAAILVEPIQGEGGVVVPPAGYLARLRAIADAAGCLLFLDEVQTGLGRTGTLFAYEPEGVTPDLLATAKGLGGGLPLGALLATAEVAAGFGPGSHGTTVGGNPLACAAGLAGLELLAAGLLETSRQAGAQLHAGLDDLARRHPDRIREVRGRGLLLGLLLASPASEVMDRALLRGLLVNTAGPKVLRILPPLTLDPAEIAEGLALLEAALTAT